MQRRKGKREVCHKLSLLWVSAERSVTSHSNMLSFSGLEGTVKEIRQKLIIRLMDSKHLITIFIFSGSIARNVAQSKATNFGPDDGTRQYEPTTEHKGRRPLDKN